MFIITPISIVLFITSAINIAVAYISWQRSKTKGGVYFALGMTGIMLWTLAEALDYTAVPLVMKIFFAKLEAIGYHSAIALFALFSILYAGNERWLEKKWFNPLFYFIPLSNILLTITNELHMWIWTGFIRKSENIVIFEHGSMFKWVNITNYLQVIFIFVNLWMASRKGSDITRRQARILMLALLFPVATNLLYLLGAGGIEGVDWTSITFSVSGLLFLYALYGIRLLDIIPIARDKLMGSLGDGMIVLDVQNRIVDINQTAAQRFGGQVSDFLGKNMADVTPIARSVLDQPIEDEQKIELESNETDKRYFDVLISPLHEHGNKNVIGRLIISRDITKRKFAEAALEQRLLEVQKLHKELQEAQTQMMEQQRAFAKLEERQRMARDMHDSVNQSIYSLVLFSETLIALLQKNQNLMALNVAERIQESGQRALREIRLLLYKAQSTLIDENTDFVGIVEERLNMVERRVGINAEITCGDDFVEHFPPAWTENLYWIIMEALNNSLKHSQSLNVRILFKYAGKQMELEIVDDGIGFDPDQIHAGGYGMKSMRERAELLGGKLSLESIPGNGTQVHFKAEIMEK